MLRRALLLKIFDVAYMQRWNDKIRPLELTELDKQAHKMIIAYFLGKFEEVKLGFSWREIIEGGIFELLQRLVVTDLKPSIFYRIKEDKEKYKKLNEWVYREFEPVITPLGKEFCHKFKEYFINSDNTINKRILSAAHIYASNWEFEIIKWANHNAYDLNSIARDLKERQEKYRDLVGLRQFEKNSNYKKIISLCGQLRFQSRWAQIHRTPKTSVLGHMLFVAILSYLFSRQINACEKRCANNYFTGLFHDLPEALTRDIISPVKRSIVGLIDLIKGYEKEKMEKEVYSLIPQDWHREIKMFTEDEFESFVTVKGKAQKVTSGKINERYNEDKFNPRDGELVKVADDLSALIEAYTAIKNGSAAQQLENALTFLKNKYKNVTLAGINFGEIYADFE